MIGPVVPLIDDVTVLLPRAVLVVDIHVTPTPLHTLVLRCCVAVPLISPHVYLRCWYVAYVGFTRGDFTVTTIPTFPLHDHTHTIHLPFTVRCYIFYHRFTDTHTLPLPDSFTPFVPATLRLLPTHRLPSCPLDDLLDVTVYVGVTLLRSRLTLHATRLRYYHDSLILFRYVPVTDLRLRCSCCSIHYLRLRWTFRCSHICSPLRPHFIRYVVHCTFLHIHYLALPVTGIRDTHDTFTITRYRW